MRAVKRIGASVVGVVGLSCAVASLAIAGCGSGDPTPSAYADPPPPPPAKPIVPPKSVVQTPPPPVVETPQAVLPCVEPEAPAPPMHDELTLAPTTFKALPAWTEDHLDGAVKSFLISCAKIGELKDSEPVGVDGHGGLAKQWRRACAAAAAVKQTDEAAVRAMFESEFVPYVASGRGGAMGKLTGYYVAEMRASRTKTGKFTIPIYGRPSDLVMVDLGLYTKDAHGKRAWGRLNADGELVPYPTRKEIRTGAINGKAPILMYIDDPVDLLFAQIEGSAKAILDDGSTVWLEFAGKNGRAYRGVGAVLKSIGALAKPGSGTMQGIRKWFDEHKARFDEVVDQSESYVFFKESKLPGAVGSQKVILTAQRSAAIDRAFIAHGTPLWIEGRAPVVGAVGHEQPWHHLLIAQDTGGGILGAVRADVYWGDDRAAEEIGGRMGGPGKYWILLPRGVTK